MLPIFIPDNNKNVLTRPELLLADATKSPITLHACDSRDYDSNILRRMMVTLTKEQIFEAIENGYVILKKDVIVSDIQNVLVITNEFTKVPNIITSSNEFLDCLIFADKYCTSIERVCKTKNLAWLEAKLSKIKQTHEQCQQLFTPIETSTFNKPKFTAMYVANANYPVGVIKSPNTSINIHIPSKTKDTDVLFGILSILDTQLRINQQNRNDTSKILNVINKIIIVSLTDIKSYNSSLNSKILLLMESLNKEVLLNSLHYAMRIMYLKELTYNKFGAIKNEKLSNCNDLSFIIPIETASAFPINPNFQETYACSYVAISSKLLRGPTNIKGSRGVSTLDNFKRKYDIYTNNVLKNVSFEMNIPQKNLVYKAGVTGSLIAACAINNPREIEYNSFESFLNTFYPSPRQTKNIQVIPIKKNSFFDIITDDLSEDENNNENDNVVINDDDSDDEDVKQKISLVADIDLALECNFENFDASVEYIFKQIKYNYPNATLHKEKTENKHKYNVKDIPRYIDIFHVDSITHVISKFHLDCVRAWYDGQTVHCYPTFICAANTLMCSDIRWVSNKKNIMDVVMKYYRRGFGTLINISDWTSLKSHLTRENGYDEMPRLRYRYERRKYILYGNTGYFGPNYSDTQNRVNNTPKKNVPLSQNKVLFPYL